MKLDELRRNPAQNATPNGPEAALQILAKFGAKDNLGISMTSKPKLGINPRSEHMTPLGVYFYPAEYYIQKKEKHKELEYVDNAPFIQIFSIAGNILHIDKLSNSEFNACVDKLIELVPTLSTSYSTSGSDLRTAITMSVRIAPREASVKTPGGQLWFILRELSKKLSNSKKSARGTSTNKIPDDDDDIWMEAWSTDDPVEPEPTKPESIADTETIIWNKLLRLIGYSAVIDSGSGIIHLNEPTQGVVVDPSKMKQIATVNNKSQIDTDTVFDQRAPTLEWIERALKLIKVGHYKKFSKRIANYMISVGNRNPKIWDQLSDEDKLAIHKFAGSSAVPAPSTQKSSNSMLGDTAP